MSFVNRFKEISMCIVAMFVLTAIFMLVGIIPYDANLFLKFIIGCVLIILGQTIFLMGADVSLIEMGKKVGKNLFRFNKIWLILFFGFAFSFCCTIAEPDVNLYVSQIMNLDPTLSRTLLLVCFGLGVGLFVLIGLYRILKHIPLKIVLTIGYLAVLVLFCFVPDTFIGIAVDGAGITTGPITAPFLIAMTVGLSSIKTNKKQQKDSFGMVGLGSLGAIISLLIFGLFFAENNSMSVATGENTVFIIELLVNIKNIAIVLAPIVIFFFLAQILIIKLPKQALWRIFQGIIVSYMGLVIFLTGITFGFAPMGYYIGNALGVYAGLNGGGIFIVLLFSTIMGFLVVFTEPSISVFGEQVEVVTRGNFNKKLVSITMGIGVAISVVVAMLKIALSIPIWCILVPVIVLCLVIGFFLPQLLVGMSFDIGGLASGTVVPAFLLPIAIGFASIIGEGAEGFGVVAIISTIPILTFEVLCLIYLARAKQNKYLEKRMIRKIRKYIEISVGINKPIKNAKNSANVFIKKGEIHGK